MSAPTETTARSLQAAIARFGGQPLSADHTLDVRLSGPVALGIDELPSYGLGCVLLGTGVTSATAQAALARAEAAGAAAVVLRASAASTLDTDGYPGAVLTIADDAPWRDVDAELDALLRLRLVEALPELTHAPLGDLFALANAVAAMVGGAITVEDADRNVLAYSTWAHQPIDDMRRDVILQRKVPEAASPEQYRRLARETGVARFHGPGEFPRLAVAVRAGSRLLGWLWAVEPTDAPSGQAAQALATAAEIAAPHLLSFVGVAGAQRDGRANALVRAVEGRSRREDLAELRWTSTSSRVLVAFRVVSDGALPADLAAKRLGDLVAVYLADSDRGGAQAIVDDTVYALVNDPGEGARATRHVAARIVAQAESALRVPVFAGIAPSVRDVRDLPRARSIADLIVDLVSTESTRSRCAVLDDVLNRVVVRILSRTLADWPELTHKGIAAIVERDQSREGWLGETLLSYLDADGDYRAVAQRMRLHVNTVRYRMTRACDLGGLDLTDPAERFVVWLQLNALYGRA